MRSTFQHLQVASYLERGIQDTLHGTLQANRDLDDPDRLQTKIGADLSMFAFGAQLQALSFLSRLDHIACLNGMSGGKGFGISHEPWIPKVNENGSISYIAEEGDNALTLQEQYGLSKKSANALYSKMKNGVISGQDVFNNMGSEVLKLKVGSATAQQKWDHYVYARDRASQKSTDNYFSFNSRDYFNAGHTKMIEGIANMKIDNSRFKVDFRIPIGRISLDGSDNSVELGFSVIISRSKPGSVFGESGNMSGFGLYHPNTFERMSTYNIYTERKNANKLEKRLSKIFPKYNYFNNSNKFKDK